jgi:hypothetical protein
LILALVIIPRSPTNTIFPSLNRLVTLRTSEEKRQFPTWRDNPHGEKAEDDFGLSTRCRTDDLVESQLTNGAQHRGDMSVRQVASDIHSVVRNFDRTVASKSSPNQLNEVWRKASQ